MDDLEKELGVSRGALATEKRRYTDLDGVLEKERGTTATLRTECAKAHADREVVESKHKGEPRKDSVSLSLSLSLSREKEKERERARALSRAPRTRRTLRFEREREREREGVGGFENSSVSQLWHVNWQGRSVSWTSLGGWRWS